MANEVVLSDLSRFVFKRILSNNGDRKFISVEGHLQNGENALLLLEKVAFTEEIVKKFCHESSVLKKVFINDAYGSYECFPEKELNGIKTTLIYPATEDHIKKFEAQPLYIVEESKEIYETVTLPIVLSRQLSLQWVYNILEHKTEKDRIVFEDPDEETGFILLPDLKWDGNQIESLYLLAVCRVRNIKSLRDLNGAHLKLLKNILVSGRDVIKSSYNIESSKLRVFVHYQPSFYHFHVHFTHIDYDAPGITCDRSHLLTNVINNIELVSDYYQRCTIPFIIKQSEVLFKQFAEKGIVKAAADKTDSSEQQ